MKYIFNILHEGGPDVSNADRFEGVPVNQAEDVQKKGMTDEELAVLLKEIDSAATEDTRRVAGEIDAARAEASASGTIAEFSDEITNKVLEQEDAEYASAPTQVDKGPDARVLSSQETTGPVKSPPAKLKSKPKGVLGWLGGLFR